MEVSFSQEVNLSSETTGKIDLKFLLEIVFIYWEQVYIIIINIVIILLVIGDWYALQGT